MKWKKHIKHSVLEENLTASHRMLTLRRSSRVNDLEIIHYNYKELV